ncbi:hypothetical protein HRbin17_02111 [bacterium HR17]|uniref:DUF2752 domain-containing protein n=1 Tax=Candidatus Fervidibacter japonicus TaxID=2035412 RepID=A0A2H5XEI4_9BACT|nr:hypothetical protein HRbin17_02111 [bacterium HR17]
MDAWRKRRIALLSALTAGMVVAYALPSLPVRVPLCAFKLLTGYPCAGCGLTRSIRAAAHGHFRDAFAWHPFGVLLFAAVWVIAALMVGELVTGKPLAWRVWWHRWGITLAWGTAIALAALWLLRLSYYRYGQWLPIPLKVPL